MPFLPFASSLRSLRLCVRKKSFSRKDAKIAKKTQRRRKEGPERKRFFDDMPNVKIRIAGRDSAYKIKIGSGVLPDAGSWAAACLKRDSGRVVIVSNPTVFQLYGDVVEQSLIQSGFTVSRFPMKDGEVHKSFRTAEATLSAFSKAGLTRTDAVVALGGGVVGDLAGFAAAAYLRGIAFLQIPTTLLAMIDSSVGGKTGVNTAFGKNLVGAFHQPSGVLIDVDTLATLPKREITAGLCEMVKHGAISGRPLLEQTSEFLSRSLDREYENLKFEISDLRSTSAAKNPDKTHCGER
jgi:3-dehydroquinate synthase